MCKKYKKKTNLPKICCDWNITEQQHLRFYIFKLSCVLTTLALSFKGLKVHLVVMFLVAYVNFTLSIIAWGFKSVSQLLNFAELSTKEKCPFQWNMIFQWLLFNCHFTCRNENAYFNEVKITLLSFCSCNRSNSLSKMTLV